MENFQVPVIAVFTKHDQFRRNIRIKLRGEDRDREPDINVETENTFKRHYLASLKGPPPYTRLESEDVVISQIRGILMSASQGCICMAKDVLILLK